MKNIKIQLNSKEALLICEVPNESFGYRLQIPYKPGFVYDTVFQLTPRGKITQSHQIVVEYINHGNPKYNYKILETNVDSYIHSMPIQISLDCDKAVYILETQR